MIFEKNGCINLEKSEDLENHALILMDPYAAILSNKTNKTQKTYILISYYPVYRNQIFVCKKFWSMRRYFDLS